VATGSPEPVEEEKAGPSGDDTDEDVDGVPLDGAALLKAGAGVARRESRDSDGDSLDGAPIGEPEKRKPSSAPKPSGFVTSKWETVDPEEVKKGAVTTSKWETDETEPLVKARRALMGSVASKWDEREEDIDGEPLDQDSDSGELPDLDTRVTEERRALLRDVEVKVMQYQDELENGRRAVKPGWTISEQVEHHRRKTMRKATDDTPRRARSPSESPERKPTKKKKRRRSRSSSRSRSPEKTKKEKQRRRSRSSSSSPERTARRGRDRSRTPKRSKRSRSRSPKKHKKKSRH
jgi:U2-associated protein SR140